MPSKAASIYDVAKEARVSVFTVSAVVNGKTHVTPRLRERVESAIRKLHYRPNLLARSLAKQKTHTLGMIVPDISNPFFPMVIRGADEAAQRHGYNLLLCNTDDNQEKENNALELLLSKRVDGILLTKAFSDLKPAVRHMIRETKIPLVLMLNSAPKIAKDAVIADDYRAAYEATVHLVRSGRKRIALLGGPPKVSNGEARLRGFQDGLKASGLSFDPSLIFEGDYRSESGYTVGKQLLQRQPDGVYIANFLMTVGLLRAAEEMGLACPDDFGTVNLDDYPWLDIFRPKLTTVELPKFQLGQEAVGLLLDRLGGYTGPGILKKMPPELHVRESCGFQLHQLPADVRRQT